MAQVDTRHTPNTMTSDQLHSVQGPLDYSYQFHHNNGSHLGGTPGGAVAVWAHSYLRQVVVCLPCDVQDQNAVEHPRLIPIWMSYGRKCDSMAGVRS